MTAVKYSDNLRNVDTYAEHVAIADKFGYVWWS